MEQYQKASFKKTVKDSERDKINSKTVNPTQANSKTKRKTAKELTYSKTAIITKANGKTICSMAKVLSTTKITKPVMKVIGITMRKMAKDY